MRGDSLLPLRLVFLTLAADLAVSTLHAQERF